MNRMDRRTFLVSSIGGLLVARQGFEKSIMTVNGPISPQQMGTTLIHEHFLVDFIGADKTGTSRWNREAVVKKVLPYLLEAKKAGVKTVFDCTPAFLGRDVILLQQLAAQSGLQLITNTGYYGAVANKYLPAWAFTETASQLAQRWISEAKNGIDDTGVRSGFIKISVDANEPLSEVHQKLVLAAAMTHLQTGLTICSHTGPAVAAFQELDILQKAGVQPSAFVWVHAQAKNRQSGASRSHGGLGKLRWYGLGRTGRLCCFTFDFEKGRTVAPRVDLARCGLVQTGRTGSFLPGLHRYLQGTGTLAASKGFYSKRYNPASGEKSGSGHADPGAQNLMDTDMGI